MRERIYQGGQALKGNAAALVGGAILPLAFAPFQFYPLAVVSLICLFYSWHDATGRQAAWRGFLFGAGMFGVGVSWVFVAIHVFGQASVALATFLTALFCAFLALYISLLGWLLKKCQPNTFQPVDYILLLPVGWLAFEWFKGWFLTGFPWLDLGVSQIEGPLSGYTPIIGALGVSWLVAFTAGLLMVSLLWHRLWPVLMVTLIWVGGYGLQQQSWTQPLGEPIKATLIQGNIPQQIKWQPQQLFKTLALYEARTVQHWDSDLIVWPENAATAFYHQLKDLYFEPLAQQARQHQTDILLGLPVMDRDSGAYFNSMMSLGSQRAFYHKQHLVPFGDYIPFEWLRGLIRFFDLPMSSFSAGDSAQPLLQAAGQQVGISVCYEDAFSAEVLAQLPAASILVNATNNAWYGDSFAPHQHLQISRNRALETGRPLLRATTNGISAFIDHKGQIVNQSPQFEEVVLTEELQPRQGATPYVNWQQWPLCIMAVFMLLLWAYHRRHYSE